MIECNDLGWRFTSDPMVRILPIPVRVVWLHIAQGLEGTGGAPWRSGDHVVDALDLAVLTTYSADEVASAIEVLVARGLFQREPDGALVSPTPPTVDRAAINRRNANARWDKHRQERLASQREMPLMQVVASRDAVPECKPESEPDANCETRIFASKLKELSKSGSNLAKQLTREKAADSHFQSVTEAANVAAGLDPNRTQDYGFVRSCLQKGASHRLILEAVQAAARPGVTHLGYFKPAIEEALRKQQEAIQGALAGHPLCSMAA